MSKEKPRVGRPQVNPPGARVWSVRVTEPEEKALKTYLERLRRRPPKGASK